MSRSLSLDSPTAAWLAGLDPSLLPLAEALPPASWHLHDVRWVPGSGCRLAYRVRATGSAATFVAVDVSHRARSQHDCRDDPELPGLRAAADPAHAADLVGRIVGERVRGLRVEPVRYRPGARCVLRYDVESESGTTTLYGKVLTPAGFDGVARVHAALCASAESRELMPQAAAVWPELQVLVGRGVGGRTVSAVLGDPAVPAGERARLAHRLGDLLARFHAQPGVSAPPWAADDQVAALAGSMDAVRCADARLASRLLSAVDLLAGALPPAGDEVLGHGAFRAGQVLVTRAGRLVLLDTDGVSRCDPARDIGSVLAHVLWQGIRQPRQRQILRGAERALLAGYAARADEVDPQALLWWRAAAVLQVAARRYRRLEVAAWPLVHELADAAESLLATHRAHSVPNGATDLLDPRQMSTVLRLALAPVAATPRAVQVDSAEELATASGRRSVVRYAVRGLDGPRPVPVIGKMFSESRRARLLHEHLSLLSAAAFGADLRVPQPLALVPEQRLVLYRPGEGVPLDRLLSRGQAADGVRHTARGLARLHGSDIRLPRRLTMSQEEESTWQWAVLVARVHPRLAGRAHELAGEWARAARSAAVDGDAVIHKDFHAGHVLVGDGVCVIDLDEARNGDPAFDVAHFCTYLDLLGDSDGRLRDVFLTEYVAASGWGDKGTYQPFCAYTWLKIAKQCVVGSGPGPAVSPDGRLGQVERALAKGEACLSG